MVKRNEVANVEQADTASTETVLNGEVINPVKIPPVGERKHKATFASDNRNGGYMIRVEGPNADAFSKREVPVTRYDGTETVEKCEKLIWKGADSESGKPIALYKFVAHKRAEKANAVSF